MGGSCLCEWIVIWKSESNVVGAMSYYIMHFMADRVIFTVD